MKKYKYSYVVEKQSKDFAGIPMAGVPVLTILRIREREGKREYRGLYCNCNLEHTYIEWNAYDDESNIKKITKAQLALLLVTNPDLKPFAKD